MIKEVKEMTPSSMMNPALNLKSANLEAEPELLKIDLSRTAVMVIDVQNAFLSKGGFFDLQAPDISLAESIRDHTEKTKRIDSIKKIIMESRDDISGACKADKIEVVLGKSKGREIKLYTNLHFLAKY